MKNSLNITNAILLMAALIFGCSRPVKDKKSNSEITNSPVLHVGDSRYIIVDTAESLLKWKGSNSFGSHIGYIHISKGELMLEHDQLIGGFIEVNMKTLEDENHEKDNSLIDHLKDPDFFDVGKFPFATIAITRVAAISPLEKGISADLTIKAISNPVSFPVSLEIKNGIFTADGKLVIDRTKWDVRYQSGKFFSNLADKAISDSIEFDFKIIAKASK